MISAKSSAIIVEKWGIIPKNVLSQNLVSDSTAFASVAGASKKAENEDKVEDTVMVLERIQYIHYPLCFQKNPADIKPLLHLGSKVNAIISGFALKLGLKACHTDVRVQKIDSSTL